MADGLQQAGSGSVRTPSPALMWTEHPIVDRLIPPLSEGEVRQWLVKPNGFDAVFEYWKRHEAAIKEAADDPLRNGFELPFWSELREFFKRKDELYALGGNGSGKTEVGAKLAVETMLAEPGRKVLCVAQNDAASKVNQQAGVYKYLPVGVRLKNESGNPQKRQFSAKVKWSQSGGFTESTFVLPNRSQCWFKTVEQYQRDNTSFEGPEYDLVWIDEPAPLALLETLVYRVGKRGGKVFFTFTAIDGFDAVCQKVITGARMLKTLPIDWEWDIETQNAECRMRNGLTGRRNPNLKIPELGLDEEQVKGCPKGHMPYLMQPLNPAQGVIFLWTHWNVFLPRLVEDGTEGTARGDARPTANRHIPALFGKAKGKSKRTVRTRLFGWAEKVTGCQFPKFNPNVHIIPLSKVPKEGTDYMSGDPATARSYFLLWLRVDAMGRKFIFDESPSFEEGEWVGDDGQRGDGTRIYAGMGTNWYKTHIRLREKRHGREAMRRKGDPRAFATEAAAREGGQSLFELFLHDGRRETSNIEMGRRGSHPYQEEEDELRPMYWEPAKVKASLLMEIESGSLDRVNNDLDYDEGSPISVENEPRLYVTENCQNLIRAMLNWSPDQGGDSPWKDPIDTLRYLYDEPLFYVDSNVPDVVGGRGW